MDPADPEAVRAALVASAEHINRQDEKINQVCHKLFELQTHQQEMMKSFGDQLTQLMEQMSGQQSGSQPSSVPTPEHVPEPAIPVQPSTRPVPHLSQPTRFTGDSGDCKTFLTQCQIHFELQPEAFPTDRAKVAYIITHLSGRAEAWATAEWGRSSPVCQSLPLFSKALTQIFQHTTPGREAARALVRLRQGRGRVVDYAIEFRTLAAESSWNPPALFDAFLEGLSESLKDQLAPLDLPSDLDSLIELAIKIDKRLQDRESERSRFRLQRLPPLHKERSPAVAATPVSHPFVSSATPMAPEEPMQVGRTSLTAEERQRRMRGGLCLYCGEQGHRVASCPLKARAHQ